MDLTSPEPMDLAGPLELRDLMDQDIDMDDLSGVQDPRVAGGAGMRVPNFCPDNEGVQVPQDPLQISLILKKVFQHFSDPALLQLSLVNKFWNREARSVMTKRGNLTALLHCGDQDLVHQDLEAFAADLRQMKEEGRRAPYSGISVHIKSEGIGTAGSAALESTYEAIFALELRHLKVVLIGKWWDYKNRPSFLLLKKLLQGFSGRIEKLALDIEKKRTEFIQHFVPDCIFTRVKVLELEEMGGTLRPSYRNYIKALVARAPQLQEIYTCGNITLLQNVMEGSAGLLMYQKVVYAPFDLISESAIHQLRLEKMFLYYTGPEFNLDRFNRLAPTLLQVSCNTTLRSMYLDPLLAVPLMCYRIRLENVDRLRMIFNYNELELVQPLTLSIVKQFPFALIFPNVDAVYIDDHWGNFVPSPDHLNRIIEQANNAVLGEPLPDRAANIKALKLGRRSISRSALEFFGQMFPDIKEFSIRVAEEGEISLGSIWKHWTNLQEIQVRGDFLLNTATLDSIFCGIFQEEVAQLREKDEEYLRRVNIVPVIPAISSFKNLKTFRLYLSHYGLNDEAFSKVSRLIAFARCPFLDVILCSEDD